MKITRETITKQTQEVEVTLPYFTKLDGNKFIAVISEADALHVHLMEYTHQSPTYRIKFEPFRESELGEPCTRAEFEAAYIKANDYLSEQFESMRDVKSGTTVEDVLKNMDA